MKFLLSNAQSPAVYLFLAMLCNVHYGALGATIDIAPETQYANLSSSNYATFYCRVTGHNLPTTRWAIGSRTYSSINDTVDGYMFSEIIELCGDDCTVHDMYLSILTIAENNETAVRCVTNEEHIGVFSNVVLLIVQGGPGAPDVELRMVNPGLIVLQWDEPFTWNHTSIEHYKITSNNPQWDHDVYTDTSLELEIGASGPVAECAEYTFTVLANNGVADGVSTTVTGGYPIVPQLFLDTITAVVSFSTNLLPTITLTIKLPLVCNYQMVRYVVTIRNSSSDVVFEEGPQDQLYGQSSTVMVSTGELSEAGVYSAEVTFDILGIEEDSPDYHLTNSAAISASHIASTSPSSRSTDLGMAGDGSEGNTPVVLIAGVSSAILLVIIVAAVFVVAMFSYRKKRSGVLRTSQPRQKPMVNNPIYDGQTIYDTIDDPAYIRPLTLASNIPPPTPTSARPVLTSPPTPNSAHPLLGYPPASVDIEPEYVYPPQPPFTFPPVEDGYTMMASAQGVEKTAAEEGAEDTRYVKEPSKKNEENV